MGTKTDIQHGWLRQIPLTSQGEAHTEQITGGKKKKRPEAGLSPCSDMGAPSISRETRRFHLPAPVLKAHRIIPKVLLFIYYLLPAVFTPCSCDGICKNHWGIQELQQQQGTPSGAFLVVLCKSVLSERLETFTQGTSLGALDRIQPKILCEVGKCTCLVPGQALGFSKLYLT